MIDPKPKVAEHNGGNIIDPTTEDQLPSSNKAMLNMFQGVRVLLDRPDNSGMWLDLVQHRNWQLGHSKIVAMYGLDKPGVLVLRKTFARPKGRQKC